MSTTSSVMQAVRIFLYRTDGRILVVTRAHHKGVYCMPGGKVDNSDESLVAAICRETKEETNLDLTGADLSVLFRAAAQDDKEGPAKTFEVVTFYTLWVDTMGVPSVVEPGVFPSWVWPETLKNHNMGGDYETGVLAAWAKRSEDPESTP